MAALTTYGAWARRETNGAWGQRPPLDLFTDEDAATLADEYGAVLEGDGAGLALATYGAWHGETFGAWGEA